VNIQLKRAYDDYWSAHSWEQNYSAYCRILLFGGVDGFPGTWYRAALVRYLRRLALWVENDKWARK
jgi:hypothetical protein